MSQPELDITVPIPLAYGRYYQDQSNPPCGVNASFTDPDFNAPGSDEFPLPPLVELFIGCTSWKWTGILTIATLHFPCCIVQRWTLP